MRVYYAKGSSHVTGCIYLYAGKLESTGSYPYSNIPYSVYNYATNDYIEWNCSGTGFAKYSINYDYDNCQTNGDVELGVGVWLFAEPADYQFLVIVEPEETTPAVPTAPAFADVVAGSYYSNPVKWAVEKGITTGTTATTFSPNNTCTRAQIITFLWRAAGSPEPKNTASFTDVAADTYYAKACAWAAENGMTSGKTFAPNDPCTREMAVEFMWKSAGSPKAPSASFNDVSAPAVDWAVANGITTGTSATTFNPNAACTRAQIVTFLWRYMGK